jgi:hypothetical protein
MFWIITLGIISVVLLLAGSLSVYVKMKIYRRRSEENRARALVEMMKVSDEAGKSST